MVVKGYFSAKVRHNLSNNNVDCLQDNRNEISFLATCPQLAAFDNSDNIILDTNAGLIFKDDREL